MAISQKIRIKLNMGLPDSAKACTEVSPKTPVRVKYVEYKTKTKLSMANK